MLCLSGSREARGSAPPVPAELKMLSSQIWMMWSSFCSSRLRMLRCPSLLARFSLRNS